MSCTRWSLLCLALLTPMATVHAAKLYKWTDENGKVHYSDRVPPDQVKQERERLNAQGVSVERTDRAKTEEEIAAAKLAAAEAAAAQRKADAERRAQETLINSYASEDDLKRAYEANVELIEQQISSSKADIELRERSLEKLVQRASQSEQAGRKVESSLTEMIDYERTEIDRLKTYIKSKDADKAQADAEYQERLTKYREALEKSRKVD